MPATLTEVTLDAKALALEIGCGKGRFVREMAKLHADMLLLGVEKFSTILARAIMNNEEDENIPANLRLIRSDALDLDEAFAD